MLKNKQAEFNRWSLKQSMYMAKARIQEDYPNFFFSFSVKYY